MTEQIIRKMDRDKVREFISKQSKATKIYIGGDSERFRANGKWYADYTVVVVVHVDGCRGAKVFGETTREEDFDQKKNRPSMRLMGEVYRVAGLYLELADTLKDRYVEVHLDINPNKKYGSSCVIEQAVGYIKGTCNVTPQIKPNAWAASFGADRWPHLVSISKKELHYA